MKTRLIFAITPLFFLISCGGDSTEVSVRELSEEERDLKIVKSSAERFRMSAQQAAPKKASSGTPKLIHETPKGWKKVLGTSMRDLNLTFGEDGKGECYLARLAGAGGGLVPNVNRWRKQMGAEALSAEEIAALPKKNLFGQPATFVDVSGNFGGMSGGAGKENYRLLGLILSTEAGAVFVKMVGPKADVDKNAAQFDEFVSSIDVSME